jgi:hypothetical protein
MLSVGKSFISGNLSGFLRVRETLVEMKERQKFLVI